MVDDLLQINDLERKIREIRNALPAHSIPAAMLIKLEELEEQLLVLQVELDKNTDATA